MGADDWHNFSITAVGVDTPGKSPYYVRGSAGDLDGDGLADEAVLKLTCTGGAVTEAFYTVHSSRDAATGQASGKRTHKPVTFVKEWSASSLQLRSITPRYDVKKMDGGRVASDGVVWTAITLGNSGGLCPELARATKTRSNIQNN